jgi:hypothetical protein
VAAEFIFRLSLSPDFIQAIDEQPLVEFPLAQYGLPHYDAAIANLDALEGEAIALQRATAQPKPHFYGIVPKESADGRN